MKILQIHISGFGTLTNKTYNFSQTNQIIAENGNGKTTLATFIECMFYGIQNKTLRSYKPYNGSIFGGFIIFEINNNVYKAERTFGSKKSEDTFCLYNNVTGAKSVDFTENLGEEIFKINRNTFISCTLHSIDTDFAFDFTSVYDKINSLFLNSENSLKISTIFSNLDKRNKELENAQHKGIIPDLRFKIEELRNKILLVSNSLSELENAEKLLKEYKKQITKVNIKIEREEQALRAQLINQNANSTHTKLQILLEQQNNLKTKLAQNNSVFYGNNLTQENLQEIQNCKNKLELCKNELNALNSKIDSLQKLQNNLSSEKDIDLAFEKVNKIKQLTSANLNKRTSKVNFMLCIFLIAISIITFISGLMLLKSLFVLGLCVILCGVIFAIWGIANIKKNIINNNATLIDKTQKELCSLLGNTLDESTTLNVAEVENLLYSIRQSKQNLTILNTQKQQLESNVYSLNQRIDGFFAKFNLNNSYDSNYLTLKNALLTNQFLQKNLVDINSKINSLSSTVAFQNNAILEDNLSKLKAEKTNLEKHLYDVNSAILTHKSNYEKYQNLQREYNLLNCQLNAYLEEKQVISCTKNCIMQAKNNIANNMLAPINNSLNSYASQVLNRYTAFNVDENFNITYNYNGFTRNFNNLSLGEKQIVYLCIKIGIINALFTNEKPFLIIDDAFAPLDDNNFKLCKEFLIKLSKNIQIIYLTPTPSRKI